MDDKAQWTVLGLLVMLALLEVFIHPNTQATIIGLIGKLTPEKTGGK